MQCPQQLPHLHLPQVPVNLGKDGYLPDIIKATSDIDVQLVFNNAGYLLTGFFHNRWATLAACPVVVCSGSTPRASGKEVVGVSST